MSKDVRESLVLVLSSALLVAVAVVLVRLLAI